MDSNRVTVRYAKALIELASEQNVLDKVDRDIRILYTSLNNFEGFNNFVIVPGIPSIEKFNKLKDLFASDFHELSLKFLQLVFKNKREEYLKDLCRNIIDMARELRGIITANLVYAYPLNDQLISSIKAKFESKLRAKVELTTETDTSLIGGFVFTIEGQQYDASVASKLNRIKKQLK